MAERLARSSVPVEQTWDLEGLYPDTAAWDADYHKLENLLPAAAQYEGRLGTGPDVLFAFQQLEDEISMTMSRLIWFATNRISEDQGDPGRQALKDRAGSLYARVEGALSFACPEILALPEGTVERFLSQHEGLRLYRLKLMDILAEKEHMLGPEAESVIAAMSELASAPYDIFQNTTAADMQFDSVVDEQGTTVPMSLSALSKLLQSPDRSVRRAAYESAIRAFDAHKRTITAAFAAAQKRDAMLARLRKYPSSLAAALGSIHLPESLFHTLLQVAEEEGAPHFQRYMAFRAKELGLPQLAPWDLTVPLDGDLKLDISFADAFAMVKQALQPLGPAYQAVLERAYQERWVDWADNKGKASGAYSYNCYGYHPVIMLNWQGKVGDAFTLAHELGHSVHAIFSESAQPYVYSHYTLFLAEMASTTNELLLAMHLLKTTTDRALRRFVLTRALGAFTSNFFGGSLMAAIQLQVHEWADQHQPLTYERITAANTAILKRFYGDTVAITEEGMGATWLRPDHHFLNFYSYQYATGISAAAAFADMVLNGGEEGLNRYLGFLHAGSSAHSIDILKAAGVDMTTPEPLRKAVAFFGSLVTELERT